MPEETEVEDRKQDEEPVEGEAPRVKRRRWTCIDPTTWPTLTDMTGTLDTSGTGGAAHNNMDAVNPVVALATVQDLGAPRRPSTLRTPAWGRIGDPASGRSEQSRRPASAAEGVVDPQATAQEKVDAAYADAVKHAENVLDPDVVPGAEETEQVRRACDEAGGRRGTRRGRAGQPASAQAPWRTRRPSPRSRMPTDMIGTLDTSGTGGWPA